MLNRFAKLLLVATSLCPILGAVAIKQWSLGKPMWSWLPWLGVAILLVIICWGLLRYAANNAQKQVFTIGQFENKDRETLTYLVTYLLPMLSSKSIDFDGDWVNGAYILGVIYLVMVHAGFYHFNPVMGLMGYHFYEVRNSDGISQLLISRAEFYRPGKEVQAVRLAHNIYLHTGGADA